MDGLKSVATEDELAERLAEITDYLSVDGAKAFHSPTLHFMASELAFQVVPHLQAEIDRLTAERDQYYNAHRILQAGTVEVMRQRDALLRVARAAERSLDHHPAHVHVCVNALCNELWVMSQDWPDWRAQTGGRGGDGEETE